MVRRIIDLDKIDAISEALGMDLVCCNGNYIDRSSADDIVNCDSYLTFQILDMLDKLSDEEVKDCIVK